MNNKRRTYICKSCGGEGPVQYNVACSACGNRQLVLKAEKGEYKYRGFKIGMTVEGDPNNPLGRRVESRPASGGKADSYIDDNGNFRIDLSNPINDSNNNETHVRKILINKLRELGHNVQLEDGARDDRGEDEKLVIDGNEFDLQIVTAPLNQNLWEDLNVTNQATFSGDESKIVSIIHNAIEKKSKKKYENSEKMILALDLSHSGALVSQKYVRAYIDSFGDPVKECSFNSVWLVGPTTRSTMPLKA